VQDHDKMEFRTSRRRVALLPTAGFLVASALAAAWLDWALGGLLWLAGTVLVVQLQRERVTVRVDPQWLLVWRQFPWFARPQLERYALSGIDRATAVRVGGAWVVRVEMAPPFHGNRVEIPLGALRHASALAQTLNEEAAAARARADPAIARSRIVVPTELTDLVDRER
jgi:hypothetical protein